jgi:hypothetical protein
MEISPETLEQFKRDLPNLTLRVRDGIEKVMKAYVQIQDIEDDAAYNASLLKIDKAREQIHILCMTLMCMQKAVEKKSDCLYIMNGKKVRECTTYDKSPKGKTVECFCCACPSEHHYWQEEWSEFARLFK